MPPSWASDSTISTPGRVGRPGKCPAKKSSSPRRCHRPRARCPGSSSVTSSTSRNGGRCGNTSSGRTTAAEVTGPAPVSKPTVENETDYGNPVQAALLGEPVASLHEPAATVNEANPHCDVPGLR